LIVERQEEKGILPSPARNRLAEALGTAAGILAASCPTCAVMLEHAVKSSNLDERVQIKEISEIVNERPDGQALI
jgi:Fe-S oxidoreductase